MSARLLGNHLYIFIFRNLRMLELFNFMFWDEICEVII
jgi:hypothetical protein